MVNKVCSSPQRQPFQHGAKLFLPLGEAYISGPFPGVLSDDSNDERNGMALIELDCDENQLKDAGGVAHLFVNNERPLEYYL